MKLSEKYSVIQDGQTEEEITSSTIEVPILDLSGDEAIEKSFMDSSLRVKIKSKASFLLTSITIMKSMVGVGILGIPNVMRNFGVLLTLAIMAFVFALGVTASNLLIKSKNMSRHSNYSTIGYYIFKHKWIIIVVNLTIILSNLGTCLSELIIFGDTTQLLVKFYTEDRPFYLDRSFMICMMALILSPLLIVKTIEKLRFVSLTAIISISTFSVLVIYNFFKAPESDEFSLLIPQQFEIKRALTALPTILLAYNWQFNLFPIFKGMENPTDKRMFFAIVSGYSMATVLYLTVGLLGYATYGNNIETNYLKSINETQVGGTLYVILNMTFVVSTTLTLPVLFFGGRNNFIQLLKQIKPNQKTYLLENNTNPDLYMRKRRTKIVFYGSSIGLFILLIIGAIFLNDLTIVFNLKGAIFCNVIQFMLPSLFFVKLTGIIKEEKTYFYHGVQVLFVLSWIFLFTCVTCGFLPKK